MSTPTSCSVVGLGLIGGSFALRLQQLGARVHGWDPDEPTRRHAADAGIEVAETVADLPRTGLALLAGPTSAVVDQIRQGDLPPAEVLIDACSAKGIVAEAAAEAGVTHLVPCHPMAGTEFSGFTAADAGLLTDAVWAVTPANGNTVGQVRTVLDLAIDGFGSRVALVRPTVHDEAVAAVSHVAHATAQALVRGVLRSSHPALTATLAAGSFRDGTRVVRGAVDKTVELLTQNRAAVREQVDALVRDVEHLSALLAEGQDDAVHEWFAHPEATDPAECTMPLASPADLEALLDAGARGFLVAAAGEPLDLIRPASSLV